MPCFTKHVISMKAHDAHFIFLSLNVKRVRVGETSSLNSVEVRKHSCWVESLELSLSLYFTKSNKITEVPIKTAVQVIGLLYFMNTRPRYLGLQAADTPPLPPLWWLETCPNIQILPRSLVAICSSSILTSMLSESHCYSFHALKTLRTLRIFSRNDNL